MNSAKGSLSIDITSMYVHM